MSAVSRVALVINSHSRRGAAAFAEADAALRAAGLNVDPHTVDDPDRLDQAVKDALRHKPDVLILGGGDGTISSMVDHLIGTDVALGLLPLGTANSFARTLGLPLDLESAMKVIVAGHRRNIDLGMIDGDYFANCAAIGISPLIAQSIPHGVKKWGGRFGYLAWAVIQGLRYRPFDLTVTEDGVSHKLCAVEVRIANGRFHGGTELVESAELDSGEIVVQVVEGNSRSRLLASWMLSVLGLHRSDKWTSEFHGKSLRIETRPPLPISIDGEVLAQTPITARAAPRVIDVMVPESPITTQP